MDFEDAVAGAFGPPQPEEPHPEPPRDFVPPDPHNEAEPPPPPPPPRRKKGKKRRVPDDPDAPPPPPKEKRRRESDEELSEKRELWTQLQRYVATFPNESQPDASYITPESPADDMRFAMTRIQQRLNAKQELQVMQTGLITGAACLEMGSEMVPNNPIKLKGFATNISSNMAMFEDCLKQIQCKYGGQMQISVEATLGMLLLRCAVTVHTQNVNEEYEKKREAETVKIIPDKDAPPTPVTRLDLPAEEPTEPIVVA